MKHTYIIPQTETFLLPQENILFSASVTPLNPTQTQQNYSVPARRLYI